LAISHNRYCQGPYDAEWRQLSLASTPHSRVDVIMASTRLPGCRGYKGLLQICLLPYHCKTCPHLASLQKTGFLINSDPAPGDYPLPKVRCPLHF
jgi:hypothetical protein